jgi:hypothetical protein
MKALLLALSLVVTPFAGQAQVAPGATEAAGYTGLHAAAHQGDVAKIQRLVASGAALNATDGYGRTPLHVATFARQREAVRALVKAGADLNKLESDRYDSVTIGEGWGAVSLFSVPGYLMERAPALTGSAHVPRLGLRPSLLLYFAAPVSAVTRSANVQARPLSRATITSGSGRQCVLCSEVKEEGRRSRSGGHERNRARWRPDPAHNRA